jgi:hypothetical protein
MLNTPAARLQTCDRIALEQISRGALRFAPPLQPPARAQLRMTLLRLTPRRDPGSPICVQRECELDTHRIAIVATFNQN